MLGKRLPRNLFFAIVFAAIVQCVRDFPLLPDRMASHFGPSGMPNGWMTKPQFFIAYALLLIPAAVLEFWVSQQIAHKPDAKLNLPNKLYWLAPERRAQTFAYFESFLAWYGCVFLFVVVYAMGLALQANLDAPPHLSTGPIVSVIGGFVLFNIVAVIMMFRRFSMSD